MQPGGSAQQLPSTVDTLVAVAQRYTHRSGRKGGLLERRRGVAKLEFYSPVSNTGWFGVELSMPRMIIH